MGTPFANTPTAQMSGFLPPGSMPNRRSPEQQSAWDAGSYGPGSFSSFLSNYREYLVRLGFAPPPLIRRLSQGLRRSSNSQNGNDTIPSASENIFADLPTRWPLPARNESEVDLRSLLPDRQAADECKEVYRKTLQKYLPAFYWSMLEEKWKRAWEQPIWEWDKEAVRSVFCIVLLLLAISCQMIEGWAGNTAGMEERLVLLRFRKSTFGPQAKQLPDKDGFTSLWQTIFMMSIRRHIMWMMLRVRIPQNQIK